MYTSEFVRIASPANACLRVTAATCEKENTHVRCIVEGVGPFLECRNFQQIPLMHAEGCRPLIDSAYKVQLCGAPSFCGVWCCCGVEAGRAMEEVKYQVLLC